MRKASLNILAGVVLVPLSVVSSTANAQAVEQYLEMLKGVGSDSSFICNDSFADRVNDRIASLVPNVCAQLDTEPSLDGVAYENPNDPRAACDMGLPMVGLPDWDGFGYDSNGMDSCGIAKMVVGDHIRGGIEEWNKINDLINDGMSSSAGIDIDEVMKNVLGN